MKEFFNVVSIKTVLDLAGSFPRVGTKTVDVFQACTRVLARDLTSQDNVPEFARSTMDGYAVCASSTFGASSAVPAMLDVTGCVEMGQAPDFKINPGQAALIPTGGMLPDNADSVVMVEHTEAVDARTIEVYKSVAPLAHVISAGDDVKKGDIILKKGTRLRPQDLAVAAAAGMTALPVFARPIIGIISTGNEVVPANTTPGIGQIRDMNTHALGGMCVRAGAAPISFGIVGDDPDALFSACKKALEKCDMLLVSGGSSVGTRDHTIEVIEKFPDSKILVHGVSISPGKPTILARANKKAVWGLPGHVVSAMVVFHAMVGRFIKHVGGCDNNEKNMLTPARLTRNIPSVLGRTDFVRVRLVEKNGEWLAEPIFGKSGVIRTMVEADGLIKVGINEEGLDAGTLVSVDLF